MFDVVLELDVGLCMCTRTSNLFDLRFGAVTTRGWILHRSMVQQLCPKMLLWTRRESSPTRPPIFPSMDTTVGPPRPCMGMLLVQLVEELIPIAWWQVLVTTVWLRPSRCGEIAMEMAPVGVAHPVEALEQLEWAAFRAPKDVSYIQDMAKRERLSTAWLKPNLRKNPELIPRVLSCQRKSLLLWVTFAHIREMKTGVLAKRDTEMPTAPSITSTFLTTQTAFHTRDPSPTRTLSSPGLNVQVTSSNGTTPCLSVAEPRFVSPLKEAA